DVGRRRVAYVVERGRGALSAAGARLPSAIDRVFPELAAAQEPDLTRRAASALVGQVDRARLSCYRSRYCSFSLTSFHSSASSGAGFAFERTGHFFDSSAFSAMNWR